VNQHTSMSNLDYSLEFDLMPLDAKLAGL